ncbi:very short patch repair endonuclease [Arabiibacter massiliensis]|uniref:very short patch repair endonuclease n=1 Tax=Arabiibacter massiliensis TaxID=1870985 RepID=UPI0009BBAAAA|nr:very short patch repair endonuclease [Arabiibacter massiliensis]
MDEASGKTSAAGERPEAPAPEPTAHQQAVRKSMQGNKRCDTKPELLVRRILRWAGLSGYRLQWKVPGRPDIAWPGKKVALFVNGCFWHRCPYCKPTMPKSHVEYWTVKFGRNVARDERNQTALVDDGWRVHVIWECRLKKKNIAATCEELLPRLAAELGKELKVEPNDAPPWHL